MTDLDFTPVTFLSFFVRIILYKSCWVKVRSPHFEGIFWMLDLRWKFTWMSQDQSRENDEYCKHFKVLHDYIVIWICCEIESCLWIYMSRFRTWLIILFEELYYVVTIKIGQPPFGSLLANQ